MYWVHARRLLFTAGLALTLALLSQGAVLAATETDACIACHSDEDLSITFDGQKISLYVDPEAYQSSVHGAFPCTACHSEIDGIPHSNPIYGDELSIAVSKSCQNCHRDISDEFSSSIHASVGVTCADCHGSHSIERVDSPTSTVYRTNLDDLCAKCHSGEVIESYRESFHGKAVSLGSQEAATCTTCHGTHDIRPFTDPESRVSEENLPTTCAQCHGEANANWTKGKEHVTRAPTGPGAPMYYTYKFFIWLTLGTITVLVVHILIELYGALRRA